MREELERLKTEVDYILEQFLPDKKYPQVIYESVFYSLFGGGKRIRPILVLKVSEMFHGNREFAEIFAAAIEMIHTYSLVHDDLPCMDDDDSRRGMPTNHKKFGYATALLAGDALLNLAYETVFSNFDKVKEYNLNRYIKAASVLSSSAGIDGMIAGQTADTVPQSGISEGEALRFIHRHKTGAIIKAAVMCGALSGDADSHSLEIMGEYGDVIGLMFQIKDDMLDADSEGEENKLTFPKVYGIEESEDYMFRLYEKSKELLSSFGEEADFLRRFTYELYTRTK